MTVAIGEDYYDAGFDSDNYGTIDYDKHLMPSEIVDDCSIIHHLWNNAMVTMSDSLVHLLPMDGSPPQFMLDLEYDTRRLLNDAGYLATLHVKDDETIVEDMAIRRRVHDWRLSLIVLEVKDDIIIVLGGIDHGHFARTNPSYNTIWSILFVIGGDGNTVAPILTFRFLDHVIWRGCIYPKSCISLLPNVENPRKPIEESILISALCTHYNGCSDDYTLMSRLSGLINDNVIRCGNGVIHVHRGSAPTMSRALNKILKQEHVLCAIGLVDKLCHLFHVNNKMSKHHTRIKFIGTSRYSTDLCKTIEVGYVLRNPSGSLNMIVDMSCEDSRYVNIDIIDCPERFAETRLIIYKSLHIVVKSKLEALRNTHSYSGDIWHDPNFANDIYNHIMDPFRS